MLFPISDTTVCLLDSESLWFSGAPSSIGFASADDRVSPFDLEELVYDASAGTDYSILILSDRSAAVAGSIDDINSYRGHFGVNRNDLVNGVNELQRIPNVIDIDGSTVTAPDFHKVYAGVETSGGSGQMHSVFIDLEGRIYASGYNSRGQLCLGDENNREFPTQFALPNNEKAISAAVGVEFTLIVSDTGKLYGCGSNDDGQIGLGTTASSNTPDDGNGLSNVRSVSAGASFSLVQTTNGLFVMGRNNYGTCARLYSLAFNERMRCSF